MLSPNIAPQTIAEILKQDERSPSSAPFPCDGTTQPSDRLITHLINRLQVWRMRQYSGCVGGRVFRCFFVICKELKSTRVFSTLLASLRFIYEDPPKWK